MSIKRIARQLLFIPIVTLSMIPLSFTGLNDEHVLSRKMIAMSAGHQDRGTFYADTLLWSAVNREVYLKGEVVVRIARNNFKGKGSFSILGEVHLLTLNGTPVPLNSPVILSGKKCRVAMLDKEGALLKYGPEGNFGAVEIKFE